MRASSVFFAFLSLATLGLTVYIARTIDLYVASICAFIGVLYVFFMARAVPENSQQMKIKQGSSLPGIILIVAVVPFIASIILAQYGLLGNPLESFLRATIIVGFSITFFVIAFSIPLAMEHKLKEEKLPFDPNYRPLVSILVPAYNEENVISRTLESLVNAKYEQKEIIVIDDGSTDKTSVIASWYKQFGVKVVKKPNGGKASALNYGMVFARGEIIVTVDADSMITRSGIDEVVKAMSRGRIAAVSGNIKVLNSYNHLTRAQELEYIIGINILRRSLDLFGAVMVVPGAFGAFKRYAIENTGYYDKDTVTEDFDLTIKVLKAYGAVGASSIATAFTEVPATWHSLYKQRMRWSSGTLQTAIKHKDAFWNARYSYLHTIVIPILVLSFVMPFASYAAIFGGIFLSLTGQYYVFVYMLGLFFLIQLFVTFLTLSLNDDPDYSLVWYAPAFVIGYKQFLDTITIMNVFAVAFRKNKPWQRTDRVGGLPAIKAKERI